LLRAGDALSLRVLRELPFVPHRDKRGRRGGVCISHEAYVGALGAVMSDSLAVAARPAAASDAAAAHASERG